MRILLIEAEKKQISLVQKSLAKIKATSCHLHTVENISQGLESLAAEKYDIVLLSINQPNGRGMNTYVSIRAAAPQLPIILLADQSNAINIVDAAREGVQGYLPIQTADATCIYATFTCPECNGYDD